MLGAAALVFGLTAVVVPGGRARNALLARAAGVLVVALALQAVSIELVRQASVGLDWNAALRSAPPYACALGALLGGAAAARLGSSDRRMPHGPKEHPVDGPSTTSPRVKIGR